MLALVETAYRTFTRIAPQIGYWRDLPTDGIPNYSEPYNRFVDPIENVDGARIPEKSDGILIPAQRV